MRGWFANLVLLVIAVVLTLLVVWTNSSDKKNYTEWDKTPRLFEGFTPDNVRILRLTQPKKKDDPKATPPVVKDPKDPAKDAKAERDELVFIRDGSTWKIADGELKGVPVQMVSKTESKIDVDILKHFKEIKIPKKAVHKDSTDEYLKDRNLSEETATILECYDGNRTPIAELYLGKDATAGKFEDVTRGYFVRSKSSRDAMVYEVDYWVLSLKAEDWAEKKIHEFETGKVLSLSLRNAKGEVTFTKDKAQDAAWKCEKPPAGAGAIRQQEVNNIVQRFMRIDATRFLGPLASYKALRDQRLDPNADYEIAVMTEDKVTYRLMIGKKIPDKGEFYAKAVGNDFLFALGDWAVTPYEKDPKDLFDPLPESRPNSTPSSVPATKK